MPASRMNTTSIMPKALATTAVDRLMRMPIGVVTDGPHAYLAEASIGQRLMPFGRTAAGADPGSASMVGRRRRSCRSTFSWPFDHGRPSVSHGLVCFGAD